MNIPFHKPSITQQETDAVNECLKSGWLTMGERTFLFENKFNEYLGSKFSVSVNSGTAALHLALCNLNLKPDDEVIIPANTFTATAEAVLYFNSKPVLVDIEKETHLVDVSKIEAKINNNTKAIIPVHFGGQPADMSEILEIAEKYDLYVVEDAAHALPSKYKDKAIGTIGDVTCFSFYATKTLTTGEGGMAVTENPDWAERMRLLRVHGMTRDGWERYGATGDWEYDVIENGFKYNMTDINASIGLEQLKRVEIMYEKRKIIAEKYNEAFGNNEAFFLYEIKKDRTTSWHLYPVKLKPEALKINRDEFIRELKSRGISAGVHFIPLYRFSCYKRSGYVSDDFKNCEWVFERTFSLPIYPDLSEMEVDYIIDNVLDITKKNKR